MPLAKELALSAAMTTPSLILTDTRTVIAALAEDAVVDVLRRPVAPAGGGFQAAAGEDRDVTAAVANQLPPLQPACGLGHADPPHPEHVREEFVGQVEVVRMGPVVRHQQPTGEPGL